MIYLREFKDRRWPWPPYPLSAMLAYRLSTSPTMSAALDYYFGAKEKEMQFAALYQSLSTKLRHEIERVGKKTFPFILKLFKVPES